MAVRIRLKRMGRRHRSYFRLTAIDARSPRDGRVLEELGLYDPTETNRNEQTRLNAERIRYWLSVGAQPTETVSALLRRHGISAESAT
jgi:small subunit ribosomal protein S16